MPIYEYACPSCGHEFEYLIMGSESPACPECGAEKLEKKLSLFSSGGSSSPAGGDCEFSSGGG